MSLSRQLAVAAIACLFARGASAQARPVAPSPIGTWRGTSQCLVRPSPCNDEVVVYRITPAGARDSASLDGRKVVKGQEEEMGVLGCRVLAAGAQMQCNIPNGTFHFFVRGDSLVGDLKLPDGTKFRDIRTARSR